MSLFIAYKIDQGMQSSTVKCYVSAIKRTLIDDGYHWDDQKILLTSLTRACRLVNDKVKTRLPIQCGLLEMILFEVQRMYNQNGQQYLQLLYKTLFALSYYGLMRVCEVCQVPTNNHVVKAKNVHAARNKDKLLIVLYTSKTHGRGMKPQRIKITSNDLEKSGFYAKRNFCPFYLTYTYMQWRGGFDCEQEQFFVFWDKSPVKAEHARNVFKST